jgi:hypothetical protein
LNYEFRSKQLPSSPPSTKPGTVGGNVSKHYNTEMIEIDYIDLINLKAISRRKTKLKKVLGYWDAYDRNFPTYIEFKNSINKLLSIGVIEIYSDGRFMILSNSLHKKMNSTERIKYLFKETDILIIKVLKRQALDIGKYRIEIEELDYNLAIKDYYNNANN